MKAVKIILDQAYYEQRVKVLLDYLRKLDKESSNLGLRTFVWNIEGMK